MKLKIILCVFVIGFVGMCGVLVARSGLFKPADQNSVGVISLAAQAAPQAKPGSKATSPSLSAEVRTGFSGITADNVPYQAVTLGSLDVKSGFRFQLELANTGAAISKATLAGFKTRDPKNPQPLVIMQSAFAPNGTKVIPLANGNFVFIDQGLQVSLNKLNWNTGKVRTAADGSQTVSFEALIKSTDNGKAVLKLTKTYTVSPNSNELNCKLTAENLTDLAYTTKYEMFGPVGIGTEDIRPDQGIMGAFQNSAGVIETIKEPAADLLKSDTRSLTLAHKKPAEFKFIWAAMVNKYFTAIIRPVPATGNTSPQWMDSAQSLLVNTAKGQKIWGKDIDVNDSTAVVMQTSAITLGAAGSDASSQTFDYQVYLGPKDKDLFEGNALFRQLGYYHTIEFNACCGLAIIDSLAFGILALMKWAYTFIPNYGWVIIILVLLVRLMLHPITKSSQISMMKMSKLGPMAEEIKKKYADNKQEMNRRMMELYKEHGASPILGCLPMLLQMPIWIALYSAIYAGIELRGQPFLPIWITDLSATDAIVRFPTVNIPLLGSMIGPISSLNLLPLLLGFGMFLQQKLTPTSSPQMAANPQMQQQQKMMLIMMPIMMVLVLYNAPSGLNLYIMASTFGGVIEQMVIRKHIREKEEAQAEHLVDVTSKTGGKVKKKKQKPFFRS